MITPMTEEDKQFLRRLKTTAPYTYMCTSYWYTIAKKYGINEFEEDSLRNEFLEKQLTDAKEVKL